MALTDFSSIQSLALPFLYISLSYFSLLLGYVLAGQKSDFFSMKGTDKLILTFSTGAFSVLIIDQFFELPQLDSSNWQIFAGRQIVVLAIIAFFTFIVKRDLS